MKQKFVKFQFGRGKDKDWYWRIRAKNGEIIAQGEGYKNKNSAKRVYAILQAAFDHNEVVWEELDNNGHPPPPAKYVGTLVTSKNCR